MSQFDHKPQDLSKLFSDGGGALAKIAEKTHSLTMLTEIVQKICPDLPENAWQIANFYDKYLVIEASSPAWGQRLQFERNKISQQLKLQTHGAFEKIEIKVIPLKAGQHQAKKIRESSDSKSPQSSQRTLSKSSASQILQVAENAPPSLKAKLEKLAGHINRNSN